MYVCALGCIWLIKLNIVFTSSSSDTRKHSLSFLWRRETSHVEAHGGQHSSPFSQVTQQSTRTEKRKEQRPEGRRKPPRPPTPDQTRNPSSQNLPLLPSPWLCKATGGRWGWGSHINILIPSHGFYYIPQNAILTLYIQCIHARVITEN